MNVIQLFFVNTVNDILH